MTGPEWCGVSLSIKARRSGESSRLWEVGLLRAWSKDPVNGTDEAVRLRDSSREA